MCLRQVSFSSTINPKYVICDTTGSKFPDKVSFTGKFFFRREKMIHFVFDGENVKPDFCAQDSILSMHFWITAAEVSRHFDLNRTAKSSTKYKDSTYDGIIWAIPWTARRKRVTLSTAPWGTPFSCSHVLEYEFPTFTLKVRRVRKFCIKIGRWPLNPNSYSCVKMECRQVLSYAFSQSKKTPNVDLPWAKPSRT